MRKILLVEDEEDIRLVIKDYLSRFDFEIVEAGDGTQALVRFDSSIDLVLLDLLLPGLDGMQVCKEIRKISQVPVVILTALGDENHMIEGYLNEADDYITKPFSMQVLLLKIRALLRRSRKDISQPIHEYKALKLDTNSRRAFENGQEVFLTPKEFDLLCLLIDHPGRVYTRAMLLEALWRGEYEERVVDTHIKNIRKKLSNEYISTIRGLGYRIDE